MRELRGDMKELTAEVKGDIKALRAELKADGTELKAEIKAVAEGLAKIDKQIGNFLAVVGVLGVLGAGALGLVWLLVQNAFQNIDKLAEVFIRVYGK